MFQPWIRYLFKGLLILSIATSIGCVQQKLDRPDLADPRAVDIKRYGEFKNREELIQQRNKAFASRIKPNLWTVLKDGFTLPNNNDPQANNYEKWISEHPAHISNLASRVELAMPYLMEEIIKRKLPMELALIPIIESGLNTNATSPAYAAGLWQIMPATGKWLGLSINSTIDERRNIIESTKASLKYLEYLSEYYDGNWALGITAYNAGNGNLNKALKQAGKSKTYQQTWKLPLKRESRIYFSKLIGLRNYIVKTGEHYPGLKPVPMDIFFTVSRTAPSRSFANIAKQYNTDIEVISYLNADYLTQRTSKSRTTILVPKNTDENTTAEQFSLSKIRPKVIKHKISPGESLSVIARQYNTTVSKLKRLNNLTRNLIRAGQSLRIPIYYN